jgi:hypothetical protein
MCGKETVYDGLFSGNPEYPLESQRCTWEELLQKYLPSVEHREAQVIEAPKNDTYESP